MTTETEKTLQAVSADFDIAPEAVAETLDAVSAAVALPVDVDLAALKALARMATPGPWESDKNGCVHVLGGNSMLGQQIIVASERFPCSVEDAAYIAAANPATMLALLERLEVAEQKLAVLGSLQVDAICAEMKELVGFTPTGQAGGTSCC